MSSHAEMVQTLRAKGHRLTPQRESVLSVIADSHAHLTADEILSRVRNRYPYLNKSAVYRSLDLLSQLGLVTQTDLGQGRIEYELYRHPNHHHLICRRCGTMQQVTAEAFGGLQKRLYTQFGFQANLDHFAIFGTCSECQERNGR